MAAGENRPTSVRVREVGKVAVIEVIGNLYLERGAPELREATHEALSNDTRQILIDLSRTEAIDSGGIGELVASKWAAVDKGGDLALVAPTPRVHAALELVHLHAILRVFPTELEALRALST